MEEILKFLAVRPLAFYQQRFKRGFQANLNRLLTGVVNADYSNNQAANH
jgi:hypothetical protein